MLKIQANTTHELIDFLWKNITSGDAKKMLEILKSQKSGFVEDAKKNIPDEKLHGNEEWLSVPKKENKKEPPYDLETRKMIWSHRKAAEYTKSSFEKWDKGFGYWTDNSKREAYEEYMKSMKQNLGCCTEVATVPCGAKITGIQLGAIMGNAILEMEMPQKKEKNMYVEAKDARTEAQQTKDYLIHSLNVSMNTKLGELVFEFGIEQKYPKTVGELRQAQKDGWLQLNIAPETKDTKRIWSWMDYVKFEDPTKKMDEEGYAAAQKAVTKAASDVKDQIVVMGPEKGLEALNSFKAETFH